MFAGGLQNPYDLAFNAQGELFTADSDMEWDTGMTWYRPTRVNHVVPGAEFGWRSGWAKWPDYYHDSLPAVVDLGRGSPTGLEFYNHFIIRPASTTPCSCAIGRAGGSWLLGPSSTCNIQSHQRIVLGRTAPECH